MKRYFETTEQRRSRGKGRLSRGVFLAVFLFTSVFPTSAFAALTVGKSNNTNLNSGLVNYWTFDANDITGTTVYDRGSGGKNASLLQGAAKDIGKIGQGIKLDGINDYVEASGVLATQFANTTFTLTGWFKTTDTSFALLSQDACNGGFRINNSGGALYLATFANGSCGAFSSFRQTATGGFTDGKWHHFAIVVTTDTAVTANNVTTIYMDGALNQGVLSQTNPYGVGSANGYQMGIRFGNTDPLDGSIDDFRIYNRALTSDEILRLYRMGATLKADVSNTSNLSSGLVGYWTFDANKGLSDSTGGGSTIALSGTTRTKPGKIGQAYDFSGGSTYADFGNTQNFGSGDFSISGWLRSSVGWISQGPGSGQNNIIGKQNIDSDGAGYMLSITSSGMRWTIGPYSPGAAQATNSQLLNDNKWHHFVAVKSGNTALLYLDGGSPSTASGSSLSATNSGNLRIGDDGTNARGFNGSVDDLRFYNRALTAEEVLRLYNMGGGSTLAKSNTVNLTNGLLLYYPFDGKDNSWTSNTTKSYGSAVTRGGFANMSTSTAPVIGRIGQGLKLDGVDDSVYTSSFSITSGSAWTTSMWAKFSSFPATPQQLFHLYDGSFNSCGSTRIYTGTTLQYNWNGSGSVTVASYTFTTNKWYHIVFRQDSNGFYTLFINNQKIGLSITSDNLPTCTTVTAYVGSNLIDRFLNGVADDVRYYNRALTDDEVTRLYQMGQ